MITDAAPDAVQTTESRDEVARSSRRVARNSLVPFVAGLLARGLSWGLSAVMARKLGPSGSGAYWFAVNLWLYASIIADFGLGTWLTREVARAPASARAAVAESLGLRVALSLIALPVLVGVAAVDAAIGLGGASWRIVLTVFLLGMGLLPGSVSAAGTALFNAHERMTFPASVQLFSAALTTFAGVAALLLGYDYVALGVVSLGVNLVTAAIFATATARTFFPLGVAFRPRAQLALIRETLPLMLNSLLNTVFFRVDVQVLQGQGSSMVGYYTNAYKIVDTAGAIPSSFVLALFPMLSRRAAGSDGDPAAALSRVYALALKLLVGVALPLALLISFGARDLTRWLWGDSFLPHSAIALAILIWFLPLSFFNGLTQYVLIAVGLQRRITPAFALAAVFNFGANLILIPRFSYVAAGAITIASEVVLLVPFLISLRHHVPVGPAIVAALRPLPAGIVMGLVLGLTGERNRLLAVVLAAGIYPVALLLSGAFDTSERRSLLSLLPAGIRARLRLV